VSALERCDRLVEQWRVRPDEPAPQWEQWSPAKRRRRLLPSPARFWWRLRHGRQPVYARIRQLAFYAFLALLAAGIGLIVGHMLA
jgi:hypothetical protein